MKTLYKISDLPQSLGCVLSMSNRKLMNLIIKAKLLDNFDVQMHATNNPPKKREHRKVFKTKFKSNKLR